MVKVYFSAVGFIFYHAETKTYAAQVANGSLVLTSLVVFFDLSIFQSQVQRQNIISGQLLHSNILHLILKASKDDFI